MLFRKPFLLLNSAKRTRMRPPLMRLTPMFYISPQISTRVCTLQASWCINSSSSYFLIELEEKVCDLKTCYNMRCIFNLLRTVFAMSHVLCLLSRNKCCWLRRCRKHNPWENAQIDKSALLVTKIYLHCRSQVNVSILLQGKPVFVTSTQRSMDGEEFS